MARIPAYERIREGLREEVRRLSPGSRLPTEVTLAERYGVTRLTVRHATSGLVDEGLISREQGRGTFVADRRIGIRPLSRLTSFTDDVRAQGLKLTTRVLVQEETDAPRDVIEPLGLDDGQRVVHLVRVRSIEDVPAALQEAWIPVGVAPSLAFEPLDGGSLYAKLEDRYGVRLRRAEQRISAVAATKEQAELLGVPRRSPLLYIERVTVDDTGKRIELALSWTKPEYELSAILER